jgi:hypothetical protein
VTIESNPFPIRYSGDGSTVTFAVGSYFLEELDGTAHLQVTIRASDGTETVQVQDTDYTVSGAGNPAGGSITFTTAPGATDTVVITRNVPDTQEVDYLTNDDFPAETHERALDKLTMRNQQRANDLGRALLLGITDISGSGAYNAGGNKISDLGEPVASTDAASKSYVDNAISIITGGSGTTDHGLLSGLGDDDHPQYLNTTRGDARYYTQSQVDTELAGKSDTGHTHTSTDITDFSEAVDDRVDALLTAGTNITLTYNDAAGTLTIAASGSAGSGDMEASTYDPAGIAEQLVGLTATQTLTNKTLTSAVLNTGVSGTAVLDEDNMASDSATKLATQQSIKAYVDGQISTHTQASTSITDFAEAVDDRVNTLLTAGSNITLTYNDAANTLTIASSATTASTWDLKSLKADYSAAGDGTTNDSTPITNAVAGGEPFYVPDGDYIGTTIAATDLTQRFYGDGQIETSDGYKRGRFFSLVDAAPSSTSNRDSIQQAFNGDMSGCQFPVEHRITGSTTLGQPTTGYQYTHEAYPHFTYLRNASGHNQSTSGNSGRTGACAYQTKVDNYGQGDAVAYNALVFVTGTKTGSTDFLANPAGVILNGTITAGADGVYLNTVEFDMQDGGYDCAGIGTVTNLTRTVEIGAKNAIWMGHRVQSRGSANVDVAYSASNKFKIGLDLVPATFNSAGGNRAITMKSGQRIFFNATSTNGWYANNSGDEYIWWSGSNLGLVVGNNAVVQCQSNNVILAPSGTGRLKATTSEVQVANQLSVRNALDGTEYFRSNTSYTGVRGDFQVESSIGGSNYFRVTSSEVNCSVQLKVNGILDIYNGTTAAGKTATGSFLRIRLGGVDRYLQIFN